MQLNLKLFSFTKLVILSLVVSGSFALQSRWGYSYNKTTGRNYSIFPNYLYKGASVTVDIICHSVHDVQIKVDWLLQEVDCMEQMYKVDENSDLAVIGILDTMATINETKVNLTQADSGPMFVPMKGDTRHVRYQRSGSATYTCQTNNIITLREETREPYYIVTFPKDLKIPSMVKGNVQITEKTKNGAAKEENKMIFHEVTRAWEDGMYHMLLTIYATDHNAEFHATGIVEMHGRYGFLSAIDWPLLPFNAVMAFLYLVLATVWIIVWGRSHKHTLKIHVIMGFIGVVGAMCHTLQFVQHATVNSTGEGVTGLLWFARILVSAQISVLYLLLMVVSTGYGINRPKLSKGYVIPISVLAVINFILDSAWKVSVDESMKIQYEHPNFTKGLLWLRTAMILIISGWILIAAMNTFIHLCRRRHSSTRLVVFSLFTATVGVIFISNIVMFGISMGWMQACRKNWQIEWLLSSFSSIGSFILLIVLMWLWRPVDTAQSYAFAPLEDVDDDMDEFIAADEEDDSEVDEFDLEKTKIKLGLGDGDSTKFF